MDAIRRNLLAHPNLTDKDRDQLHAIEVQLAALEMNRAKMLLATCQGDTEAMTECLDELIGRGRSDPC